MLKKIIKKIANPHYLSSIRKAYYGLLKLLFPILDVILLPVTIIAAFFLKSSRKRRFKQLPLTKKVLFKIGVYPILDHYYEPLFNPKHLKRSLRLDRNLPGIDLNVSTQLEVIGQFDYNAELLKFPIKKTGKEAEFYYDVFYPPGDSEYLYNMIRLFKPGKVVEIGCGYSTLMALNAHRKNTEIDPSYKCEHICIEPYRHDWLEKCDVTVLRSLVENVDKQLFKSLGKNDILFIDSSHMIRPQGDVLFEYLELLPILNSGVLVHVHDIFTPKDYLNDWVENAVFWNEQYLLEAFLSGNKEYEIICASNFLLNHYPEQYTSKCPIFKAKNANGGGQPGSFWLRKK